jgi:hypothetical protein
MTEDGGMPIGNLAEWAVAIATILLAAVAVFQDWIRSWIFAPALRPSIVTAPPDCVWVPIIDPYGGIANTVHARVLISNHGRATALNVEVYARELRRLNQAPPRTQPHGMPQSALTSTVSGMAMKQRCFKTVFILRFSIPSNRRTADVGLIDHVRPQVRDDAPAGLNPGLREQFCARSDLPSALDKLQAPQAG